MPPRSPSVEHLGAALGQAGMPLLPARIFAALLCDDDGRMTAAQLAAALTVSAGSVSSGVGYLERVRMLRREREPGSRKDVFVVLDDAWHDTLLSSGQLYAPIVAALREASGAATDAPHARDRLALSVEFLEFIQDEMTGIARRWEERSTPRG